MGHNRYPSSVHALRQPSVHLVRVCGSRCWRWTRPPPLQPRLASSLVLAVAANFDDPHLSKIGGRKSSFASVVGGLWIVVVVV